MKVLCERFPQTKGQALVCLKLALFRNQKNIVKFFHSKPMYKELFSNGGGPVQGDNRLFWHWLSNGSGYGQERVKTAKTYFLTKDETAGHSICALTLDAKQRTALWYAVAKNQKELLKLMLDQEANW